MRRATITLHDDLDERVERFRAGQPARPSLTAVVQAALESYLDEGTPPSAAILSRVLSRRADIRRIVSAHGGSNARLFGSVARGEASEASDIDLVVEVEPGRTLFDIAAMRAELEALLGLPVDVVTPSGLGGDAREEVLAEALTL